MTNYQWLEVPLPGPNSPNTVHPIINSSGVGCKTLHLLISFDQMGGHPNDLEAIGLFNPGQTPQVPYNWLLGDLGNWGLPGVKKGSSKPSGAHMKHAPAGARYPAHVARARYESILAGWIPPEYRVPRQ